MYKRILLKMSGEVLAGDDGVGIDEHVVNRLVDVLEKIHQQNVQIGLVVGGGNFLRGAKLSTTNQLDQTITDQMGMLATVMNGLMLGNVMQKRNIPTRVLSAIPMTTIVQTYMASTAQQYFNQQEILILSGGTGNPYFTTDTAAVLRGIELNVDVILKGTKVDGVYDRDPVLNPNAKKYSQLTYLDVLKQNLRFMDGTAISLCQEHQIPIIVFNIDDPEQIQRIIMGEQLGTIITD